MVDGINLHIIAIHLIIIVLLILCLIQIKSLKRGGQGQQLKETQRALQQDIMASRQETLQYVQGSFQGLGEILTNNQKHTADIQDKRLAELNRQFALMAMQNEQKLEQMRQTVDEKLQKTLNDRITQSFQLVNERLEQVYAGLGEMKTLASGVGDLNGIIFEADYIFLGRVIKHGIPK